MSGLTLPFDGADVGVGVDGSVYVASSRGLLAYGPTGGAPVVLRKGSHDQVVVVG